MIELLVNGRKREIAADGDTPLLYVLRDELELNAAKFGCGLGQCGACTVLIDGVAALSCVTPVALLGGREITTLEGLGSADNPGPMQQAFIDEQAAQCGFCIPGMMMRAQGLLENDPHATDADIRAELENHLCRCGTHLRILRAIRRAATLMAQTGRKRAPTPDDLPTAGSDAGHADDDPRHATHSESRERPQRE